MFSCIIRLSSIAITVVGVSCARPVDGGLRRERTVDALAQARLVIESPEYARRLEDTLRSGRVIALPRDRSDESAEAIIYRIRHALDEYERDNSPIVAECRWKRPNSRTRAYDGGAGPIRFVCRYLDHGCRYELVGTVVHEISHKAGYRHEGNSRSENQCTIPYIVGDLAEMLSGGYRLADTCVAD